MNALVAYFSASGVTEAVAKRLANAVGAPLCEIVPVPRYTDADLNWMDKTSRSTVEMKDESSRPPMADRNAPVSDADVVFVGFPIWWYREPSIIDTFLEAYDFSGKVIVPFATSGGSGLGKAPERMAALAKTKVLSGRVFSARVSEAELKTWAEGLGL
jgi:flavodoxin